MKKIIEEFKTFIARGNVMDMAVGVVIGGAFKAIIDSLVNDIISPLLGMVGGADFSAYKIMLGTGEEAPAIAYGSFITAIINFLLMAVVIFLFVKVMNTMADKFKKKEEAPAAPTTKVCPYCKSEIPIDATKCAHCTSDVE